ncbi:MAG: WbqC family protein [Mariprofundaceae bacterium]
MKLAIMQPYLFPHIGYFQLIHSVDTFVVYDDVNFIKGGWINRNFILSEGQKSRITLQLQGASSNVLINQVLVGGNREKILKTIQQSYVKAPQFSTVFPLLEEIVMSEENNLAKYLNFGLRQICDFLSIAPEWYMSSDIQKDNTLSGQDKVISICNELHASHYINSPGGSALYEHCSFEKHGLVLSFIQPEAIEYCQFKGGFMPHLSIIDVLMFNDQDQCSCLLDKYICA